MSPPRPATAAAGPLVDATRFAADAPHIRQSAAGHHMYEKLISIWATGLIEAAYDLGVFERLTVAPVTSDALAAQLGTEPRATRVLCDALMVYGVLTCDGDGRFAVPADVAPCFVDGGLYSLSGKIFYDRRVAWNAWRGLADAVRLGPVDANGAERVNQISDVDYEQLVGGINFWAPPIVGLLAPWLRERHGWGAHSDGQLLDVGCGTGIYSQLLLREFPNVTACGLDVPRIVPIARSQAKRLGVRDRFTAIACDFFTDSWPANLDLVLFVNIFHLQHKASAQRLLRRSAEALRPGGVLCIVDHIVDRDGPLDSPQDRFALLFAASMLATGGGNAHALREYDSWLAEAGLRRVDVVDAPMHRMLLATHVAAGNGHRHPEDAR